MSITHLLPSYLLDVWNSLSGILSAVPVLEDTPLNGPTWMFKLPSATFADPHTTFPLPPTSRAQSCPSADRPQGFATACAQASCLPRRKWASKAEVMPTHLVFSTFSQFLLDCRHPTTWPMAWRWVFSEHFLIRNKLCNFINVIVNIL